MSTTRRSFVSALLAGGLSPELLALGLPAVGFAADAPELAPLRWPGRPGPGCRQTPSSKGACRQRCAAATSATGLA